MNWTPNHTSTRKSRQLLQIVKAHGTSKPRSSDPHPALWKRWIYHRRPLNRQQRWRKRARSATMLRVKCLIYQQDNLQPRLPAWQKCWMRFVKSIVATRHDSSGEDKNCAKDPNRYPPSENELSDDEAEKKSTVASTKSEDFFPKTARIVANKKPKGRPRENRSMKEPKFSNTQAPRTPSPAPPKSEKKGDLTWIW